MSTDLPIKNWINSTKKDVAMDKLMIFNNLLNFGKISGTKIPKGIKIIMFPSIFVSVWVKPEYFI